MPQASYADQPYRASVLGRRPLARGTPASWPYLWAAISRMRSTQAMLGAIPHRARRYTAYSHPIYKVPLRCCLELPGVPPLAFPAQECAHAPTHSYSHYFGSYMFATPGLRQGSRYQLEHAADALGDRSNSYTTVAGDHRQCYIHHEN